MSKKQELVNNLAAEILKQLDIDKTTGVVTEKVSTFEANLPEGLTKETIDAVDEYNTNFVAAGVKAFGELSVNAMVGNKKLESSSGTFAMGSHNKLHVSCDRSKQFANSLSEDKTPVTKYGHVTATLEVRAGKNGGALKAARNEIAALAMEKLK